jgi:hypothetical protein
MVCCDTIVITNEYKILDPFTNGEMTTNFYSTTADTIALSMIVYYEDTYHVEQMDMIFNPAMPSLIQIVYTADGQDAVSDTLGPIGPDSLTNIAYSALLYDKFGNKVTDSVHLTNVVWSAGHSQNLIVTGNDVTYSAKRSSDDDYSDTLMAGYKEGQALLFYDKVIIYVEENIGIEESTAPIPLTYNLYQNQPNPFNPVTIITFDIPLDNGSQLKDRSVQTCLIVYNIEGRKVAMLVAGYKQPGKYRVCWDGISSNGSKVVSGIYFLQINAGQYQKTIKMIYMR